MTHRIFSGAFSALEERWLAEVGSLQADDRLAPVVTLVGSNLLAAYLSYRIAGTGRTTANLRFYTFVALAARLAGFPAGVGSKPALPPLGASAILESLLEHEPPAAFRAVAEYAGFRHALLDTFRDLRDAGISPAELTEGVRRCVRGCPDRNGPLSGLVQLYTKFRERVHLFHDVDDDFRRAVQNTPRAAETLGVRRLLIYGIYDVTGQQADLLANLKDALELCYFIPFVGCPVSEFAQPFVQAREKELNRTHESLEEAVPTTSVGRLHQCDFGFKTKGSEPDLPGEGQPLADDGSFALISAPGESRAGVEIVREILRAVRDGAIAGFHEAAVILRQPETDVPVLSEALRLRGIPFFIQGGVPFVRRPLARAVLAIAGLEANVFSRQAILTAMEWVSAALPPDSAVQWDVAEWRALTNDPRFLSGVEAWNDGTLALLSHATRILREAKGVSSSPTRVEDDEARPVSSVSNAQRRLDACRTLRRGWERIRDAACGWPALLSWGDWSRLLQDRLEPLLKTSPDWSRLSMVLDEIASLADMGLSTEEAVVSRARLAAALEESLATLTCPEGRFMRQGVNLISVAAARGLRFPLVIVPGLEEGRFPARLRQDPLLLDDERRKIGSPPRLPLKARRGEEERLLFDMAARSAIRRLVLVTARLDESSDRERIPSEFLMRVAAAARGGTVLLRDLAEGQVPGFRSVGLENPAPRDGQVAVDRGEIRLRLITGYSGSRRTVLQALAQEEPDLIRRPLAFDEARWKPVLTAFDGRLHARDLLRHVAGILGPSAGPVSPSRLETYAKCPYLFYLERVMELEAWEEIEAPQALDPLDRGQIIHKILERFLSGYPGEAFARTGLDEMTDELMAHARPALEHARPAGMIDLLWEIELTRLERLLRNWLTFEKARAKEGLRPSSFERPFGKFGPDRIYPELRVQAGKHEFVFRGRIDRIDLSSDGKRARVIDYKTGKLPDSMEKRERPLLMAGEKMQVAIYRSVLPQLEGYEHVEGVEGEYLHLQPADGKVVPCAFDRQALEETGRKLPEVLEIIGDGILSGVFFARSSGSVRPNGHCSYCDFLAICGKDRRQREELKAADPAIVRFELLKQIDAPGGGTE